MDEKIKKELAEFTRQLLILQGQSTFLIERLEAIADKAAALHSDMADSIKKQIEYLESVSKDA